MRAEDPVSIHHGAVPEATEGAPRHRVGSDEHADPLAVTAESDPTRSGPRTAPIDDALVGATLAHFRIDAPLGRGGMGAVYRGWDTALERPVAIKVLTIAHPQARERFLREARAQAKVRHPNVVPIHFVGEQDGVVFLSMDLVEGASVADRLRGGRLPVEDALDIVDAVAEALAEGQRNGLVHRDVKPSNVLCTKDGRVLLADFGLAKAVGATEDADVDTPAPERPSLTHQGAIVGTPAYMAPEQTRGAALDHRADMYALGVTLYEMVTGQPPFSSPDAATLLAQHREEEPLPARMLVPALPPAVDAVIERLMKKAPDDRFETFAALREAVAAARVRPATSAGFFARAGAMSIDLLAGLLVAAVVSLAYEPAIWPTVALLYGLAEARWGRTLGKRLFDLRVVGAHDERPAPLRAIWRNVVKYAVPIALGVLVAIAPGARWIDPAVGLGVALWGASFLLAAGARKRGVHDRASGTRVVYDLAATR